MPQQKKTYPVKKKKPKPFFSIPKEKAGITYDKKILQVKKFINKNKTDLLLVTSPENIAWILNIRGQDSYYSPIPNSRLLIDNKGKVTLFANPKKIKNIRKQSMNF